jgi:hypothetical protein
MARITVGSLVRHTLFDTIGIVIEHTMWNGDWGAFRVKFNKPYDRGSSCPIKVFIDRADRWELISGCDIP